MNKLEQKHFILESLNSKFEIHHDKELENKLNFLLKDRVHSGHTAALYSDHMNQHNLKVLRFLNKDNEIEYCLHNDNHHPGSRLNPEEQNKTAALHAMKIINDDSFFYLSHGRKIKIQSANIDQHNLYKKFAKHLIRHKDDRKITDVGKTPSLSGEMTHTLMIEGLGFGAVNFVKLLLEK